MSEEKLIVVIKELGYAIGKNVECYQLYEWKDGGTITHGKYVGQKKKEGWVAMECYPRSLAYALTIIRERSLAKKLDKSYLKDVADALSQIDDLIEKLGGDNGYRQ